jgi:glutathione S-transferase
MTAAARVRPMNAKPILYDFPFSGNAYKVRLLLHQLGISFERRIVDILDGQTHRPEFLLKNAMGQVPVLELEDGTLLRESSSILLHLAENTELMPTQRLQRTRVMEWLCFEQSNVDQVIARARFRRAFPAAVPTRADEFDTWLRHGYRALDVLEKHLVQHSFLVAERYSIADLALYAYTHRASEGGFEMARYAALQRWFRRIEATPGYVSIDAVTEE